MTIGDRPEIDRLRALLSRPAESVAAELLGWHIVSVSSDGEVRGRIVEVEAYAADDPASHAARGRTDRNAAMFGSPGIAYVFRSYGLHWCLNVVVAPRGEPAAILLRAAEVVSGIDLVRSRRGIHSNERQLLSGPGCLAAGLAVDCHHDRSDLLVGDEGIRIEPDSQGGLLPAAVRNGPRVGVSRAVDRPWRWWVADSPAVSRYRRATTADS